MMLNPLHKTQQLLRKVRTLPDISAATGYCKGVCTLQLGGPPPPHPPAPGHTASNMLFELSGLAAIERVIPAVCYSLSSVWSTQQGV